MQMQIIIDRFLRSEKSKEYKLNIYEKLILIMLASYMGDKLNCWPSFESLEEDFSMSEDSLIRYTKALETKKLLKITRRKNRNNEYEFTETIFNVLLVTRSQRPSGRSQRPTQPAMSGSNNINNNINNNKKSYPQPKNWSGLAQTADKASPLLEEQMRKDKNNESK